MIPAFTQASASGAEVVQHTDRIRITFDDGSEIETSELLLQNDGTSVNTENNLNVQFENQYRAVVQRTYTRNSANTNMILFVLESQGGTRHEVEWPLSAFSNYISEPDTSIGGANR
jgi:hypothetical protein